MDLGYKSFAIQFKFGIKILFLFGVSGYGQNNIDLSLGCCLSKLELFDMFFNKKKCVNFLSSELKARIEKYFKGDEEALPSILEAILQRKLTGKHEETDDELVDEFQMEPLDDVKDKEFESDFEEMHETDEEIDDLYDVKPIVMKRMVKDEFFNMDDQKWDGLVKDAIDHKIMKDTKECEEILEDMLKWDNLLPGIPFCFNLLSFILNLYVYF